MYYHSVFDVPLQYTVEPLIKATPDVRAPLYTGHFAESLLVQINP